LNGFDSNEQGAFFSICELAQGEGQAADGGSAIGLPKPQALICTSRVL